MYGKGKTTKIGDEEENVCDEKKVQKNHLNVVTFVPRAHRSIVFILFAFTVDRQLRLDPNEITFGLTDDY